MRLAMDDEDVIAMKFDKLSLNLQRAVEDAIPEVTVLPRGGYCVPSDEWEAIRASLKAIHEYANSVLRGNI